ncbi:MAG TPA: hypothetical protein VEQ58_06895 [Polyangiaceae bacterium]|nr:hypothetical protein [Polyangiaceae bacterium]
MMRQALLLLGALPLGACSFFQKVSVEPLATSFARPSNIAAFVAVTDGDDGVTELSPSNFRVYENGELVPADQTELTLLDPNLVAAPHVVLLVDMSAAQTPEARSLAAKATLGFVQKVTRREPVTVFAFDGSTNLQQIAAFPRSDQAVTLAALEAFTPRDSSRNLNGAVVAGLDKLKMALAQNGKLIKLGTLVVYASGPDVAGRVKGDDAHDKVWASPYDVVAIGVGEKGDDVESLARSGFIRVQQQTTLPIAFEEAADLTLQQLEKHYLVSFCSPARAGTRQLRLEVTYANKEGDEHHGSFETEFSARAFGPGCNSLATPHLTLVPKEAPEKKAEPATNQPKGDTSSHPGADAPDSRGMDQGEDAPVAPPEHSGYAK